MDEKTHSILKDARHAILWLSNPQLRERCDSLDPFALKDELEGKLKPILQPSGERPGIRPQGGASEGSKARPPARLVSPSKTQKHINS